MYKFLPTYYAFLRRPLDLIIHQVSEVCGVEVSEIRGDCRCQRVVVARAIYAKVARMQGYSYPQIGREVRRGHSCIQYYVKDYKPTPEFDYFLLEYLKRHPIK